MEIKDDIINVSHDPINICDLLIAFMINNNLDVAYDVGDATTKGKKVLIFSADYSEIHFYLKQYLLFFCVIILIHPTPY